MDILKLCPWCGSPPAIVSKPAETTAKGKERPEQFGLVHQCPELGSAIVIPWNSRREAIVEAWNSRRVG